jgi:transposase-like protein
MTEFVWAFDCNSKQLILAFAMLKLGKNIPPCKAYNSIK